MPRVIIVSNRVTDPAVARQAGGVSVAIADMIATKSALWFGWGGEVTEDAQSDSPCEETAYGRSTVIKLALSRREHDHFYLGYSNSVLWPVFHNRLDLAQFEAGYFAEYKRVNRRFAEKLAPMLRRDDVIWIHDYHFMTIAKDLRDLGVRNAIGFFLHIPVPPPQAFLAIPEHVEIAHALSCYDLIGLQSKRDVGNMIDFLQESVFANLVQDGSVRFGNQSVRIASFPVGIDSGAIKNISEDAVASSQTVRIIGADRLDYTKGLPQKFRAYGKFLADNPEFKGRVLLSQIAPPTRASLEAYSDIRGELESLAGSINGLHGDLQWSPVQYLHQTFGREELFTIYRSSKVALITPLRDGMNLVCKEYVAAQNPDDPGVLVLSRFAGAAESLTSAVLVNPYNIPETAAAIKLALEMPLDERRQRHADLLKIVTQEDSAQWSAHFLAHLNSAYRTRQAVIEQPVKRTVPRSRLSPPELPVTTA
jgi:trehalose 6-phosphate synthase